MHRRPAASGACAPGSYNRAMPPRFFAPALAGLDAPVPLPEGEAAHLSRVLRLAAGDTVAVFDGRGTEYLARVEGVGRDRAVVRPYRRVASVREPAVALTVASALLKGRKFDDVVRDATMVGAAAVQPLTTARTLSPPRDAGRWGRIAVASAKQSRRAFVPEVRPACSLERLLDRDRSAVRLLLAEPGAADAGAAELGRLAREPRPASATLAIGPEGGWSADEVAAAAAAGFRIVTFGRLTFRADAVVACTAAVLLYIWGDL